MAKITMQALADEVGVSRITVWKVLTGRPGVSPQLQQRIYQTAARIGFTQDSPENLPVDARTFSVAVSRPDSTTFWMEIIHHIAKELSKSRCNLMYTYMPTVYKDGYTLPPALNSETTQGMIVLNVYDPHLLSMLSEVSVPKIFLDTVPELPVSALHSDLVLIEGRTKVRDIVFQLAHRGYKKIGFIGDIHYALTNQQRFEGYQDGLALAGIPFNASICRTDSIGLDSHEEEIGSFLDHLSELPEAIVCASDFIAHFVQKYLDAVKRPVPPGFLLTGFDNSKEYREVADQITTVDVATSALGKSLARKLLFRSDYPNSPAEVTYIDTQILWRGPLFSSADTSQLKQS